MKFQRLKNCRTKTLPSGGMIDCRALSFLGLWFFGSWFLMPEISATAQDKALRHIVMYKFKDGLPPEQIQEVVDAFGQLPKKIGTIVGYEHGTNISPEGKSEGFTHVFVVSFKTAADRDAYLVHPAHQDYVKVVQNRRDKVIVFDYWSAP